jgi:hypothetical protein
MKVALNVVAVFLLARFNGFVRQASTAEMPLFGLARRILLLVGYVGATSRGIAHRFFSSLARGRRGFTTLTPSTGLGLGSGTRPISAFPLPSVIFLVGCNHN